METHKVASSIGNWISNSVSLKLIIVIILTLLLLIPSSMIRSIIHEREFQHRYAVTEVSRNWAESQIINGPVLSIPLLYEHEKDDQVWHQTLYWHILPESLTITGNIEPQKLHKGIYEIVVYTSTLHVSGAFRFAEKVEKTDLKEIQYDQAFLSIGISDLRGIQDDPDFRWNRDTLEVQPGTQIPDLIPSGVTIAIPDIRDQGDSVLDFSFTLQIQGSHNLSFVPLGNTTEVDLSSSWAAPGFDGNFLPDSRTVTDTGFQASWKILELNRNFPQTWTGALHADELNKAAFGVNLVLELDDYQKSMRSIKYAIMTIALTFLIFFLVEILNKKKIHPFQYTLVGLALCLFYVLLVSISEHSNFNFAYVISACGIIAMISLYSARVFKAPMLTLFLTATLVGIYGFLFVTLQLKDYALLMGSIGLTIILGLTMYLTRNIDWYRLKIGPEGK